MLGSIGTGWGLSTICYGILYKLMHRTEADIILSTGLIYTFVIAIIASVKYFRSKRDFYKKILLRIIIIGGLGLFLCFTSNLTITKIRFRHYPDFVRAYEIYLENPHSEEAKKQLDIERNKTMYGEDYEEFLKNYQP